MAASRSTDRIVFLHGGGLTAHTWDNVCLGLHSDYRCYALDLRGHGKTDQPEPRLTTKNSDAEVPGSRMNWMARSGIAGPADSVI